MRCRRFPTQPAGAPGGLEVVAANQAIEVKDLAGDGEHYAANVVSAAFVGKSRVQQHQMVYGALKGRMGGALHALALTTAPG